MQPLHIEQPVEFDFQPDAEIIQAISELEALCHSAAAHSHAHGSLDAAKARIEDYSETIRVLCAELQKRSEMRGTPAVVRNPVSEQDAEKMRELFRTKVTCTLKPWYPDDSGEWVEVPDYQMCMPEGLSGDTMLEALYAAERQCRTYTPEAKRADLWWWGEFATSAFRIVAYKVVK